MFTFKYLWTVQDHIFPIEKINNLKLKKNIILCLLLFAGGNNFALKYKSIMNWSTTKIGLENCMKCITHYSFLQRHDPHEW